MTASFDPFPIGPVRIEPGRLFVIAGPCVLEGRAKILQIARTLEGIARSLKIPMIFKSSFDKANRTRGASFRGPGLEDGLGLLDEVRSTTALPILSDVHETSQVPRAARTLDCLQIPAFLSRQTDLLQAAGASGRAVNVKKGQFLSPPEMAAVAQKVRSAGARGVLLTERGTCFGYNNLVSDFRAISVMRATRCPVVFDATHSVQLPGALGEASGGQREFIPVLARAAVGAGCDGLFFEVHPDPDRAPSDGPSMFPLALFEALLRSLLRLHEAVREADGGSPHHPPRQKRRSDRPQRQRGR
ncbi:MAG: 3-deoxy-8-phosphooctulonate synthase [Planctomycetes bacterium]|nr:3-deoxy-8-phosphooctulonate synthase [Planctomycetota bacterium]